LTCYHKVSLHTEEIGILTLHEQSARVITKVIDPALKLPLTEKELIIESWGEEKTMGAVVGFCLLPYYSNRQHLAEGLIATLFET